MYENKIVHPGIEPAKRNDAPGDGAWHILSWEELTARLDAARDFRRIMAGSRRVGHASFNSASALHLAAHAEGKPGINPFALTNGKIAEGMGFVRLENDASGDRGNT